VSYQAGAAHAEYILSIEQPKRAALELRALFQGIQQQQAALAKAPAAASGGASAATQVANNNRITASIERRATLEARLAQAQNTGRATLTGLAQAENIYATALEKVAQDSDAALRIQTKLQQVQNQIANGGKPTTLPRSLDGLTGSAAQVALGFLSIQAAQRAFTFVKTGAEVADVAKSFDNLSKAAGTTGPVLLGSLRAAADGTITDASLIKSANLGLLLTQNRIAKDLPALTTIARAAAKATGQDIDFIFDSLVRGIARGSPKIIDNAGITLDADKAFQDYARSIGKSADALTDAERQQATLNAVLKDGAEIVKTVGLNADDSSVKIAQATVAIQNLGSAIATKISPFAGTVAEGVTNALNTGGVAPGAVASGNALQSNLVARAQSFSSYAQSVASANDQLQASFKGDPLLGFYAKARLGLEALTPAQFAYAQSLIQTGTASGPALAAAQRLTEVNGAFSEALRNSTDTARAHRAELEALAPQIFEVANQSDHNNIAVQGLLTAYANGNQTIPGLIEALAGLSQGHDIATQAAAQEEREMRQLQRSFVDIVPAANIAASAIAGALGAANLVPENRHIGGTGNTIGAIIGGIGAGAGAASSRFDSEQQALQSSRDNLALARARTSTQKIAIYQQQLARQTTEEGRNRILAQIESEKNSGAGRVGAAKNTALQLNDIARTSGDDRLRIERENLERLRDQELDFDVRSARSKEDFERQKRRLLAEGKRFEAKELEDKFNLDQQRAREDFDRERRRTVRNNTEALGDQATKVDNRIEAVDARAAAKGIKPTGTASLGGGTAPASLGGAQQATGGAGRVISITFPSAIFAPDGQKLGDIVYPFVSQRLDDDIALEIRSAPQLGGNQTAIAGVRP
jgi:hypothetical protein